jgi:hypothetical protein
MNEKELDIVAKKVADIVMDRFKEERVETAKLMAELWWNTPIDTDKHKEIMRGKTIREGLDEIKTF